MKCGLGMLRRSKNLLTSKAKHLLYFGQIHSHLCYCLAVWGSMLSKQLIMKLTNVQHKAVALKDPSKEMEELFKRYKILKVTDLIHLELYTYRQDRLHKKGRGVAILISSKLRSVIRHDLSSKLEESECVTLEIRLRNGDRCLVSSMY